MDTAAQQPHQWRRETQCLLAILHRCKRNHSYIMGVAKVQDVASNHDLCYARSPMAVKHGNVPTDKNTSCPSLHHQQNMPASFRRIVIDQSNSCLLTHTDFRTLLPLVRSWNQSAPQYHIVYLNSNVVADTKPRFPAMPFSLSGTGTKRIPVARPQIIAWGAK